MAEVHRISPILPRQGPKQLHMRLYHDSVEFLRALCLLEASVGSTAPVKERRVPNDPNELLGADFDQIPVSIIFGVIPGSPYRIFCFVGDATQVGLVRDAFLFCGQCNMCTSCLISVRLTWPRTPFLRSSHLTALSWYAKND